MYLVPVHGLGGIVFEPKDEENISPARRWLDITRQHGRRALKSVHMRHWHCKTKALNMAQQVRCTNGLMCEQGQDFTWLFNVGQAERGGDPGDRVEGEGEEDGDSKLAKHADQLVKSQIQDFNFHTHAG